MKKHRHKDKKKPTPIEDIDKSFLEVDELSLDKAWVGQPALYFKWAEKTAKIRLKLDEAKAALDLQEADLDRDIRDNPDKFDLPKVSEPAVKMAILRDTNYQICLKTVNHLQYKRSLYEAVLAALDHRKRALENLVQLHGQNYFSTPQAKGEQNREGVNKMKQGLARRRVVRRDE